MLSTVCPFFGGSDLSAVACLLVTAHTTLFFKQAPNLTSRCTVELSAAGAVQARAVCFCR